MATYQRGKYWWYRFRFAGERIDEPTKSTSRTVAKEAERQHRRALESGYNNFKEAGFLRRSSTNTSLATGSATVRRPSPNTRSDMSAVFSARRLSPTSPKYRFSGTRRTGSARRPRQSQSMKRFGSF